MGQSIRSWLAPAVLLAAVAAARAQAPVPADPPGPASALRPPTREELDRREALRLYGLALVQERDSRLIEAIESLEKAGRLDPDSAALRRALVPLYLAVDRPEDALDVCHRALDLEPGDYESWYVYARQLKVLGRTQEAVAALDRATACPGLKERPELRLQVHFDLGVLHENAQEFAAAEAAFSEVADLLEKGEVPAAGQPGGPAADELVTQTAETYERLGRVCVRAKHFDRAVAAYRKAQEKDPQRRQRLCYNLADVYAGQGKLAEALVCLEDYLKTQPQGTEAYDQLIDLLNRLGRGGEVLPALERYAAADAQNQPLQLLLGRRYDQAGRRAEAERLYQEELKKSVSADVYRGLFALYRGQGAAGAVRVVEMLDGAVARGMTRKDKDGKEKEGDPGEAAKARAMLAVLRDDAGLVKAMLPVVRQRLQTRRPLQRDTCRVLALLANRTHQLADAEQLYRDCLVARAGDEGPNEPDVYTGLLNVLWQEHKYEDVVDVCRQGLNQAQATNLIVFHLDLSRALVRLGQGDEAVAEAGRAVDIAAQSDERLLTRRNRVWVLALAGRADEAEAEGLAMLKEFTTPDEVQEVRYSLSEVYSLAKKFPQAEEQLQLILKEHPEEVRAHNDLGYIWADQGKNLEEAEGLIRAALDLDRRQRRTAGRVDSDGGEDNAAYLDSLGWVLFKRGRAEAAREAIDKACRLPEGADDPVVWDHAGDVYYKLGEADRARAAWRKAVDLYDTGGRRQPDDRRNDIEHKLKLLGAGAGR
jgi:tetratricopeptide (TPR) repeat protein